MMIESLMSHSTSGDQAFITVACPVCGTRLDERVSEQARAATCPDCHTQVPIPAAADIPPPPKPKPLPEVGIYGIEQAAGDASMKSRRAAAERHARRERALVLVVCPICAARIDTLAKREARRVKCPDCHEPVRIPSQSEVDQKRKRQPKKRPPPEIEPLPVSKSEPPSTFVPTFFAEARAAIRREEVSPPPKWTYFSRVYSIPWHAEVFSRWVYLSVGLTVMGLLIAFLISMGAEMAGSQFGMVIAFFVLPLIWICTWTLSYAAACSRAILEDTAAGSNRISSWHEQNWREWVLVLTYVGFLWGLAIILGHVTARLVEQFGGPFLPTLVGVTWFAFPIILLSSLEADSVFVPLSVPIARSLWRHLRGWAMFYLLSTLTVLAPDVVLLLAADALPHSLLALLLGPVTAAAIFIYARLLGRLGWLISRSD